jgi:predicted nuclease with TOPRIM domain
MTELNTELDALNKDFNRIKQENIILDKKIREKENKIDNINILSNELSNEISKQALEIDN